MEQPQFTTSTEIMKFDYMTFINNILLLFVSVISAYMSRKFNNELESKTEHRETKLRKLDCHH